MEAPTHSDNAGKPGRNVTVSIIILTWNSEQQIGPCLAALERGLKAYPSEVIVVDNGSTDQTRALIKATRPDVRLLCNPQNRGVAPARNQGIRHAQGEYVLILDDDTVVQPNALDCLIRYMEEHPQVGLCGPKLTSANGTLQLSCRRFPTLIDKLARRLPLPETLIRKLTSEAEMANWDHATVRKVDYVIGACQAIRHRALEQVGLFDERIFYGPEDVDMCLRLQQSGWSVVYNPEAVVVHEERRITRSPLSSLFWKHAAGLGYYFRKHGYLLSRKQLYSQLMQTRPFDRTERGVLTDVNGKVSP